MIIQNYVVRFVVSHGGLNYVWSQVGAGLEMGLDNCKFQSISTAVLSTFDIQGDELICRRNLPMQCFSINLYGKSSGGILNYHWASRERQ